MLAADLDLDGDRDVAFGNYDGTAGWLENMAGERFEVRDVGQRESWWRALAVGDIDGDGDLDIVGGTVRDTVIQWFKSDLDPPLPGDANRDGRVDLEDFHVLARNFGKEAVAWTEGDFDRDGRVTFQDFLILAVNFGRERRT